ncbi:GIY-YIG nuclease family protein [Kingella negevensis]|nr:GIY-YIG nuclease family protein [Kingella negevensis]MDK4690898.1 GIY-YIG nuclease family protein [Kingella negevensis]MDK4693955.1 GIY-YIG nuclease family protein [Kingella negevensis]MDK4696742.1 GIY-YIG nuclease family protein [Kingella negevensis]
MTKMWSVYLILCDDETLYCGITNNAPMRLIAHQSGKGARYTRMRGVKQMREIVSQLANRSEASKWEWTIKQMTRQEKWAFWESGVVAHTETPNK